MLSTRSITHPSAAPTPEGTQAPGAPSAATPSAATRSAPSARLAGLGALGFVGVVILQNVLRGSSAPTNGASADEVLTHYADTRGLTFVLVLTFVIGGISLATFLGGVMRRLTAGARSAWTYTGYAGAVGILALFSVLVASEQALSVVAHGEHPDPAAVSALWALHNSVFTVLLLFIGIALLGLGRAGVAAGITPQVFRWLAPLGTGLLAIACVAGPGIAAGELNGLFAFGLAGFAIWLTFLTTTGLRLARDRAPHVAPLAV